MAYYRRSERVLNRANVARSSYRSRKTSSLHVPKYWSVSSVLNEAKKSLYSGQSVCIECGRVWTNEEGAYDSFFTLKHIDSYASN